jgi:hypothetical protein
MPRVALTVTNFQNPDGSPVALGYLLFKLITEGSVSDTQISSQITKIPLDINGTITGSPTFWPNSSIAPAGTYYVRSVYTAQGQLVSGPSKVTV